MTYDLLLQPRVLPNRQALAQYFSRRAHYLVIDGRALYDNQNTEVYFNFTLDARGIAFHLNYIRCHVFALEAIAELETFAKTFSCMVSSLGRNEAPVPFSRERFLREWFQGNAEAYRNTGVMSAEGTHLFVESKDIETVWRWNAARTALQERYSSQLQIAFVPTLRWGMDQRNCQPIRYTIWSAGVWIALPGYATHVILSRKKYNLPDTLATVDEIAEWPGIVIEDGALGRVLRAPMNQEAQWLWDARFREAPNVPPLEVIQKVEQDHVHDAAMTAGRLNANSPRRLERA